MPHNVSSSYRRTGNVAVPGVQAKPINSSAIPGFEASPPVSTFISRGVIDSPVRNHSSPNTLNCQQIQKEDRSPHFLSAILFGTPF